MLRLIKILLVLCLLPNLVWSQENKLAIIRKIQGGENISPYLMKQLEKIAVQVVARQPNIELMLSPTQIPDNTFLNLVAVESDISKQKTGYSIHSKLIDIRTKKLINSAILKDIREEDLQRLFESALQSLFDPWNKEFKKKDPLAPKKTENVIQIEKKKNSKIVFNQQQDAASIDFKKRVKELKMGVDEKIDEINLEQKEINKNENAESSTKPINNFAEAENLAEVEIKQAAAKKEIAFEFKHKIRFGYDSRSIQALSLISTTTTSTLLNLNATGIQPLSIFKGVLGVSYEVSYARPISVPAEISSPYKLGIFATYMPHFGDLSLGFVRESMFFINLPFPGAGLKGENVNVNWLEFKFEKEIDYKGLWNAVASYATSLGVETNYAPIKKNEKWTGRKMKISICPPFRVAKWATDLSYEKLNLISQGDFSFTLNESRLALSVMRSF